MSHGSTQGGYKLILVPAGDVKKAQPGEAGTPASGEWVWLQSPQDWDVGPYEVAADWTAEDYAEVIGPAETM